MSDKYRFNSRVPRYNDDSNYTTNAPSYYDDLARKNALLEKLAHRIWEYQELINQQFSDWDDELTQRFLAWDKNLEEFDDEVLRLLQEWMEDGTLDHIINDTIFSWKADKTYVDDELAKKSDLTYVDDELDKKSDITYVDDELDKKAEQKFSMQSDFVSQVANLIGGYEKMYYKRENSLGWIAVMLRNGDEHVTWNFRSNVHDDFIILGDCFYGDLVESMARHQDKDYESSTGNWETSAPNSHYTNEIGATFTTVVNGENIEFKHFSDDRGGVWEFVIDDDAENPITLSTYSEEQRAPRTQTLVEGLQDGDHTIVATFKGEDPDNPPSSSTARGWVWVDGANENRTFRSYKKRLTNNKIQDLLVGFSNKEFAFRTRKAGTSHNYQFIPMHSGVGTAFKKEEPQFIADDKHITPDELPTHEFYECNKFSLIQSVYGRNPNSENENLVEINTVVTINKNGNVELAGKLNPLTDIDVSNGYGNMFPVRKEVTTKAITSIGNEYPTIKNDNSSTYMTDEEDKTTSFMFVSEDNQNFVASINFNDPRNTLRTDADKDGYLLWIEHRDDDTTQKLYYRPFYNQTLTPQDVFKFSATFNCGKVYGIYNII